MTQTILRNTTIPSLTRQADQQGLTPLHLAASFNSRRTIIPLLMADRHVAYMKDTEGRTALHIAAYSGHKTIMKKILSSCPDCYELVDDKRGWNALHFAVNSFYPRGAVRLILQNSTLKSLWNEKDADGNTVLHHHSNSSRFILQLGNEPRLDQMAFNKQNLDAFDVALTNEEIGVSKVMQYFLFHSYYQGSVLLFPSQNFFLLQTFENIVSLFKHHLFINFAVPFLKL